MVAKNDHVERHHQENDDAFDAQSQNENIDAGREPRGDGQADFGNQHRNDDG